MKNKRKISKRVFELGLLVILSVLLVAGLLSGAIVFGYNYVRCGGLPLEVEGSYFRLPSDNGYGFHIASDYSHCYLDWPDGLQRDPSTAGGAKLVKKASFAASAVGFTIYVPDGYPINLMSRDGPDNDVVVEYLVAIGDNEYIIHEMKKGSAASYNSLCFKPVDDVWTGKIIGRDSQGRQICRTISRYISEYIVNININNTDIKLVSRPKDKRPDSQFDADAKLIFSSMKPRVE